MTDVKTKPFIRTQRRVFEHPNKREKHEITFRFQLKQVLNYRAPVEIIQWRCTRYALWLKNESGRYIQQYIDDEPSQTILVMDKPLSHYARETLKMENF